MLDTYGLVPKLHSKILAVLSPSIVFGLHYFIVNVWCWCCVYLLGCPIPLFDDPDKIVIPTRRTSDKIVKNLSYFTEDEIPNDSSQSSPLFGGHLSWKQREESFKLKSNMKVNQLSWLLNFYQVYSKCNCFTIYLDFLVIASINAKCFPLASLLRYTVDLSKVAVLKWIL